MSKFLYYAIVIALLSVGITKIVFDIVIYYKLYQFLGGEYGN